MENEIPRLSPVWEHSLTTILGHDPSTESGIALRHWVHFQGVQSLLDLLSWDQEELKLLLQQKFGLLHTSGCLMVDLPRMDYLWDVQKDFPGDKQVI